MEMPTAKININLEEIIANACKMPGCKIEREDFLRAELHGKVCDQQLQHALKQGTIAAGIPISLLDCLAKASIKRETITVTGLSAATGIPGGWAMAGTIPADLAQFYVHTFRIAQKLAYIYGYQSIRFDDALQSELMIFLGVMHGVGMAQIGIMKFAIANASHIGAHIAAKPLTKSMLYVLAKKVLATVGVKLTKSMTGKAVSKAVPVLGALTSGGLTWLTYPKMAKKLQEKLSYYAAMSPEDLQVENAHMEAKFADIMAEMPI